MTQEQTESRILYIEYKGDGLDGSARITRVSLSKSGKSVYYNGRRLVRIRGYKANHCDAETGEEYWVSGPRKDGLDRLYPGPVDVDDDVREEYWREIRNRPDLVDQASFRSPGKYTKRGRGKAEV